jgi:hypothetical protein
MKVAMTSSSAGAKGAGWDGSATPAFFSALFSMSTSILVARRSAAADLLTSCVTAASRLVIPRWSPSIVRRHRLVERLDQQRRQVFRVPSARVAGLPFLETGVHGRFAAADRVIVLVVRHMRVLCFGNPDSVDYRNALAP